MRVASALWIIGLSVLCSGCSLVADGVHVVAYQTSKCVNECLEHRRNRQWADEAWERYSQSDGSHRCCEAFEAGFKDGFEYFLYRGGSVEPPPLAPPCYRSIHYQSAAGYQAIEDWFSGYRCGATVARDGGYRQYVTGPSSVMKPDEMGPPAPPNSQSCAAPPRRKGFSISFELKPDGPCCGPRPWWQWW